MGDRGSAVKEESCCGEDVGAVEAGGVQTLDEHRTPGEMGCGCEETALQRREVKAGEYGTTLRQVVVCPGEGTQVTRRDGEGTRRD